MAAKKAARQSTRKQGGKPRGEKIKLPETDQGTVVFNIDPLIIKNHYEIDYIHSYAEDSPFFVGLSQGKAAGKRTHRLPVQVRHAAPLLCGVWEEDQVD